MEITDQSLEGTETDNWGGYPLVNGEQVCSRIWSWELRDYTEKKRRVYARSMGAYTFVPMNAASRVGKPHAHRKALLKWPEDAQQSNSSWVPVAASLSTLHLPGWLPQTFSRQFSNRVESVEGVGKVLVKMLSPRKPKRPAIGFPDTISRDAKERDLVSVTWWPLTQRWRVTRHRGPGRQDAWDPNLVPVGVREESPPPRWVPEARTVLRCLGGSQRGLSTAGSRRREGSRRTCRRSHRENCAHGTL